MRSENSGWGAPKIHGELLKLGFHISERTVGRYLRQLYPPQCNHSQNWLTFLSNHREVLVAFDFFTVPTLTFQLLYCFLVIEHGLSISEMSFCHGINNLLERFVTTLRERYERYWTIQEAHLSFRSIRGRATSSRGSRAITWHLGHLCRSISEILRHACDSHAGVP